MADDSLDFDFPAPQALSFPPAEMMLELAKGLEEPVAIAERYGYTPVQFSSLVEWEPFRKEYERMVNKLESEGVTFRNKAVLYATDLLDRVYAAAKRPDVTLPQLLEAAKYMTKAGDLDPKQSVNITSTSRVVYEIVRDEPSGSSSAVYESTAVRVSDGKAEDAVLPPPETSE